MRRASEGEAEAERFTSWGDTIEAFTYADLMMPIRSWLECLWLRLSCACHVACARTAHRLPLFATSKEVYNGIHPQSGTQAPLNIGVLFV